MTDGDLVRRSQSASDPGLLARLRGLVTGSSPDVQLPNAMETAVDLMTTPVMTIPIDTTLVEALRLMMQYEIKRLPVVDAESHLVGLLGRASVLRGLLEHDAA